MRAYADKSQQKYAKNLMKEHDSFHAFLTQLAHVLAVFTVSDTVWHDLRSCQMLSDVSDVSDVSDATNATTLNNTNNTFNINNNAI